MVGFQVETLFFPSGPSCAQNFGFDGAAIPFLGDRYRCNRGSCCLALHPPYGFFMNSLGNQASEGF